MRLRAACTAQAVSPSPGGDKDALEGTEERNTRPLGPCAGVLPKGLILVFIEREILHYVNYHLHRGEIQHQSKSLRAEQEARKELITFTNTF